MKKRFAASAMILAMSAATVLSPLTAFAEAEEQELNIAIFQGGYGDAYWNQMVELFFIGCFLLLVGCFIMFA